MNTDHTLEEVGKQFDVTRDQQLITQAVGSFDVISCVTSLEARLSLQGDSPAVGEAQTAFFELTNVNNLAVDQLGVRLQLIDPGAQNVIESQLSNVSIAPGATTSASAVFDTSGLDLKNYSILLEAFVDEGSGGAWVNLASANSPETVRSSTPSTTTLASVTVRAIVSRVAPRRSGAPLPSVSTSTV